MIVNEANGRRGVRVEDPVVEEDLGKLIRLVPDGNV